MEVVGGDSTPWPGETCLQDPLRASWQLCDLGQAPTISEAQVPAPQDGR